MLPTIRTILHATDFSDRAAMAFQLACSLARDVGAKLIVLYVAVPPVAVYGEGMITSIPGADLNELRAELIKIKPEDPRVAVEYRLVEGDAVEAILHEARAVPCDLIVLGTHGRTGLSRLLMGSVAEQVLRRAPCPVLTVRAPVSKGAENPAGERTPEAAGV